MGQTQLDDAQGPVPPPADPGDGEAGVDGHGEAPILLEAGRQGPQGLSPAVRGLEQRRVEGPVVFLDDDPALQPGGDPLQPGQREGLFVFSRSGGVVALGGLLQLDRLQVVGQQHGERGQQPIDGLQVRADPNLRHGADRRQNGRRVFLGGEQGQEDRRQAQAEQGGRHQHEQLPYGVTALQQERVVFSRAQVEAQVFEFDLVLFEGAAEFAQFRHLAVQGIAPYQSHALLEGQQLFFLHQYVVVAHLYGGDIDQMVAGQDDEMAASPQIRVRPLHDLGGDGNGPALIEKDEPLGFEIVLFSDGGELPVDEQAAVFLRQGKALRVDAEVHFPVVDADGFDHDLKLPWIRNRVCTNRFLPEAALLLSRFRGHTGKGPERSALTSISSR